MSEWERSGRSRSQIPSITCEAWLSLAWSGAQLFAVLGKFVSGGFKQLRNKMTEAAKSPSIVMNKTNNAKEVSPPPP